MKTLEAHWQTYWVEQLKRGADPADAPARREAFYAGAASALVSRNQRGEDATWREFKDFCAERYDRAAVEAAVESGRARRPMVRAVRPRRPDHN